MSANADTEPDGAGAEEQGARGPRYEVGQSFELDEDASRPAIVITSRAAESGKGAEPAWKQADALAAEALAAEGPPERGWLRCFGLSVLQVLGAGFVAALVLSGVFRLPRGPALFLGLVAGIGAGPAALSLVALGPRSLGAAGTIGVAIAIQAIVIIALTLRTRRLRPSGASLRGTFGVLVIINLLSIGIAALVLTAMTNR